MVNWSTLRRLAACQTPFFYKEMTQKQKDAIRILNDMKETFGKSYLTDEKYMTILKAIWDNNVKEVPIQPYPFVPQPLEPYYDFGKVTCKKD